MNRMISPDVVFSVHKHFHIEQVPELEVGEDEDPLHQHHLLRLHDFHLGLGSGVGGEVVGGDDHFFPPPQSQKMSDKQVGVKRVWVVKVVHSPLLQGEVGQILRMGDE